MKEYCLVSAGGHIVNMSLTAGTPSVTAYQKSRGFHWVPVSEVSQAQLEAYEFYGTRP